MPANIVKPGLERYWTKAKKRAAEEGHENDWPYVVGIYKRMTVNKSGNEALTPSECLEQRDSGLDPLVKALVIPQGAWSYRTPGQIPDMQAERTALRRAQRNLDKMTNRKPKPNTAENEARDVESKRHLGTVNDVLRGLGFNSRDREQWRAKLEQWKGQRLSDAEARAAILDITAAMSPGGMSGNRARRVKAGKRGAEAGTDGGNSVSGGDPTMTPLGGAELRRALVARALRWRRQSLETERGRPAVDGFSRARVLSPDELRRAQGPSGVLRARPPKGRKRTSTTELRKALLARLPSSPAASDLRDLADQWGADRVAKEAASLLEKGSACYARGRLRTPPKGKRKRRKTEDDEE